MTIIWIAVGIAVGWLIPQPTLVWDETTNQRVGLLKWIWLWVRDKAGMN